MFWFILQEVISGSSAECNKDKAKDSSNTVGERIGAGIDYAKDKANEAGHAASKEVNKQKAIHQTLRFSVYLINPAVLEVSFFRIKNTPPIVALVDKYF